jgi:hypothetical protein
MALALIAGVPNSPLATRLPAGGQPPAWAADLARRVGLRHVPRPALIALSLLIVAGLVAVFTLLLREAWSGRVRLLHVLVAAGASLAISTAAPLMLSRDVFSYAAYARLYAIDHLSPYVVVPAQFPHDPFVQVTAAQWRHVHSLYGPAFMLLGGAIVRAWPRSPGTVILAFKAVAGLSLGVATACSAMAARAIRPQRAALAAAIVGLNPVLVMHTVGGGHNDAMIAAALSGALALAVADDRSRSSGREARPVSLRALGVTALLTVAVLIKALIAPVLLLWLWHTLSVARGRRLRAGALHAAVVAGLSMALFAPFVAGWHTVAPLATLGGVESWASPSRLVARGARALATWLAGPTVGAAAGRAVVAVFLLLFVSLAWRIARRWTSSRSVLPVHPRTAADELGTTLLLLALSVPYLLPWYACWFAPLLGSMQDDALVWIGVAMTELLALTLVPADPFHGLTTGGVMLGVHYVVAPLMLLLFIIVARRAWAT